MSATDAPAGHDHFTPIPRHAGLLKAAIILATLMQVLDMTIANVALPHMQAALGANQDSISWVLTSYIVASATAIPVTGWLSDRLGRRRLYLFSVAGFIAASVLCGVAANIEEMVLFRILQGISGAFLSPLAQTVLLDSTPPEKRGQAMAMLGMGIMLGPILGPVLGGWLTESMNWRWVFFVNIPLGAVAFVCLWFLLPDVKRPSRQFDLLGFGLLALALASLQLLLDRGQHVDWFSSAEIWLELGISISAFWIFVVHMATGRNTLYSREMFADANLIVGAVLMIAIGFIMTAAMALLPVMLEGIFGYPVLDAGMLLSSRGIGVLVSMGIASKLLSRVGARPLIVTGLLIVAFSFWEMSRWSLDIDGTYMMVNGFVQGLGMGMLFVPITTMAFATLPMRYRTDGASLLNLSRSMGSSIGVSVVVTLLARHSATSHAALTEHLTEYRLWIDPQLFAMPGYLSQMGLSLLDAEVTRQAMMIAFLNDFYFMMIVTLCALPLTLLIRRPRQPQGPVIHMME